MPTDLDRYRADWAEAYEEVTQLHMLRYVWRNLLAMLQGSSDVEHNVLDNNWLVTCYTRTLAVGIRRQTESGGRPRATIGDLLRRIPRDAALFTRERCAFSPIEPHDAHRDPWPRYADSATDPLDADRLAPAAESLRADAAAARRWVNKRVAHLDRGHPSVRPTFGDLESALAGLRDAMMFLHPLFNHGAVLATATPWCDLQWLRMFEKPWYVPGAVKPVDSSTLG